LQKNSFYYKVCKNFIARLFQVILVLLAMQEELNAASHTADKESSLSFLRVAFTRLKMT